MVSLPGTNYFFLFFRLTFYCQFADEHFLHVAWYVWDMVPSKVLVFLAVVEEVLSKLSGLFFFCSLWREAINWLEFGLFKFMVPVTVFGVRSYVPLRL